MWLVCCLSPLSSSSSPRPLTWAAGPAVQRKPHPWYGRWARMPGRPVPLSAVGQEVDKAAGEATAPRPPDLTGERVWPPDSAPYLDPSFQNTATPSQTPQHDEDTRSHVYFGQFGHFILVKGAPELLCYPHSTEYLPLCSAEQRHSYRFGTTWGWVNDDRIFIFGWTIPLSAFHYMFGKMGGMYGVPNANWVDPNSERMQRWSLCRTMNRDTGGSWAAHV